MKEETKKLVDDALEKREAYDRLVSNLRSDGWGVSITAKGASAWTSQCLPSGDPPVFSVQNRRELDAINAIIAEDQEPPK